MLGALRGCPVIFRRYPYRVEAFHPRRPMAPVVIKSREPIESELTDLQAQGYVIASYRAPGISVTGPQASAKVASEAGGRAVPADAPTDVLEPASVLADMAPNGQAVPAAPALSKRVQLEMILSETPDERGKTATLIARELAPRVGLTEATARKYIGEYRATRAA